MVMNLFKSFLLERFLLKWIDFKNLEYEIHKTPFSTSILFSMILYVPKIQKSEYLSLLNTNFKVDYGHTQTKTNIPLLKST